MEHEDRLAHDADFAGWYRAHHDRIRALCARILRDPIAAEDVAQETLLRAWERREQMREEDLGAWLSVVARNLCLSMLRKDGRLIVTDELPEHADLWADPAIEVGRRESRRHVRKALGLLGERSRRVIDLREVREAAYEEIGSELGVSAEGARAIAFRARRLLREHLKAVGEGLGGWLVGVKIRISDTSNRVRVGKRSSDVGAAPFLQAGLNLALAAGIAFSTLAGPGSVSPSITGQRGDPVTLAIPGIDRAAPALMDDREASAMSQTAETAGKGRAGILGQVSKSPIAPPAAYDPETHDNQIGATVPIVGPVYIYGNNVDDPRPCASCETESALFRQLCRYEPRLCYDSEGGS